MNQLITNLGKESNLRLNVYFLHCFGKYFIIFHPQTDIFLDLPFFITVKPELTTTSE